MAIFILFPDNFDDLLSGNSVCLSLRHTDIQMNFGMVTPSDAAIRSSVQTQA